jgi:hypothetical protein
MSDPFQPGKPIEKIKADNEKAKPEGEKFHKEIEKVKSDNEKSVKEIEKVKADNEKPLKEKVEVKEHKLEIKEGKQEVKEHKLEVKEHKGDKEKAEFKEHKLEIKEFKVEKLEVAEKPPVFEKGVKEDEGPLVPGDLRTAPGLDREVLLRHADALESMGRELRHFIERGDRPDLSRGALRDEPDQGDESTDGDQ